MGRHRKTRAAGPQAAKMVWRQQRTRRLGGWLEFGDVLTQANQRNHAAKPARATSEFSKHQQKATLELTKHSADRHQSRSASSPQRKWSGSTTNTQLSDKQVATIAAHRVANARKAEMTKRSAAFEPAPA